MLIDAAVRHVNGFGKLRWGRTYEGVVVKTVRYFDSEGRPGGQVVFVGTAYDHMLPEDYADMVERLGFPRPELPVGLEDVNALDLAKVTGLARPTTYQSRSGPGRRPTAPGKSRG